MGQRSRNVVVTLEQRADSHDLVLQHIRQSHQATYDYDSNGVHEAVGLSAAAGKTQLRALPDLGGVTIRALVGSSRPRACQIPWEPHIDRRRIKGMNKLPSEP